MAQRGLWDEEIRVERLHEKKPILRPRFHIHNTPAYASWLNQVERWFGIITQRAIRRGSFSSVKELIAKIEHFIDNTNKVSAPLCWNATADSSLAKPQRLCLQISGT
jgi:putative transposase